MLLENDEFAEIRRVAGHKRMMVAKWVRQALRAARKAASATDPRRKVSVVRKAVQGAYPAGVQPRMLTETESAYLRDDIDNAPSSGG